MLVVSSSSRMNQAEWDAHYRSFAASTTAADPHVEELVLRYAPSNGPKRALDLACGAGANALWLAGQGWNVTAVDRSPAAIDLLQAEAVRRALSVTTHIADLELRGQFTIESGTWDLILMSRYLQVDLFESALLGLATGGLLIVIALLADPALSTPQRYRVRAGELASHFRNQPGFAIVHQREVADTPDDFSHRRAVAEICVRRDRNP